MQSDPIREGENPEEGVSETRPRGCSWVRQMVWGRQGVCVGGLVLKKAKPGGQLCWLQKEKAGGLCSKGDLSSMCFPSSQHLQGLRAGTDTSLAADKPGSSCPLIVDTSPPGLACKHYLFWKVTALFSNKTLGHAVLDFPDLTLT